MCADMLAGASDLTWLFRIALALTLARILDEYPEQEGWWRRGYRLAIAVNIAFLVLLFTDLTAL